MDNAHIHHGLEILELAEWFGMCNIVMKCQSVASNTFLGVHIIFMPYYSPNLNPIEEAISKIKAWIQRHGELFTPGDGMFYDVKVAMDVVTPEDAEGYFTHAGYFEQMFYSFNCPLKVYMSSVQVYNYNYNKFPAKDSETIQVDLIMMCEKLGQTK